MNAALPSAVLWDMDGTLIDSEPYWFDSQSELVARYGGTWTPEDALDLVGAGLWYSGEVLRAKGVPWEIDRIVDHMTDEVMDRIRQEVPWRPGARELLRSLHDAGVPTALVTMSIRRMAELVADAIPEAIGIDGPAFEVIVSGSDVELPKPHPEAYLLAAERLGVPIEDCVVIEDSATGLAAAVASGATAIAVPHIVEIPDTDRHTTWPTLDGRGIDDITELLATRGTRIEEDA
ncbi:HAD family phosphatase [Herbiconiux sp. L3-i23]|uniref:HAD family hydrolase n=1 Tax=Herbiconiux sp. L3-i23 TaxID=2905871 RepID=UPI0020559179|nr:HAD family phosphatase [Herbiconiux sp. L3-i23]BDI22635.1 haloacid dehalogenase [Herbiconiux sp. L3-i23]